MGHEVVEDLDVGTMQGRVKGKEGAGQEKPVIKNANSRKNHIRTKQIKSMRKPEIPFLTSHTKETLLNTDKDLYTKMFFAELFTIRKH